MPEPYPNPFVSLVRSVASFKHYVGVRDQPFSRTLIFLVVLALLVTVLTMAASLVSYGTHASEQAAELKKHLAGLTFADKTARADGEQPRTLPLTKTMLVVLDTTGKVDTPEQAVEFAGCQQSARLVFFGHKQAESFDRAADGKGKGDYEKVDYSDSEKLAELRKLVEEAGARLPQIAVENGVASFALASDSVHVAVHNAGLLVLVDTTGKGDTLEEAAAHAAGPQPARILFFGRKGIESRWPSQVEKHGYSDAAKVAEVRRLVEAAGAKLPKITIKDGAASFDLDKGKVHTVVHTPELLVLADATDKGGTLEEAAGLAVGPPSARIVLLGPKGIESRQLSESETYAYSDKAKLAELRKLVRRAGGKLPDITVKDGAASFALAEGKLHVLVHTSELMVMVDKTAKGGKMADVVNAAAVDDEELRTHFPPQFLALVAASGVSLKAANAPSPKTWEFKSGGDLSGDGVAEWLASAERQALTSDALRRALPMVFQTCLFLFIFALVCSVAGLIANGVAHGELAYGEVLTMSVYAATPGVLASVLVTLVLKVQAAWVALAAPFAVGMLYVVLGVWRAASTDGQEAAPTI